MELHERFEKLISKTFISGMIGLLVMYLKPELAVHIVEIIVIIAGHHVATDFFDMKKATK